MVVPCLLALSVAISSITASDEFTRSGSVLVRRVISGDTIELAAVGRVRLLGIDARPVGIVGGAVEDASTRARQRLESLVLNRWVRLERDPGAGPGGRWRSAYVLTEEGTFVNAVLVREGLVRVAARTAVRRLAELQRAELEAKRASRGIWHAARSPAALPRSPSARVLTSRVAFH
jgi:micrococcal nuclease